MPDEKLHPAMDNFVSDFAISENDDDDFARDCVTAALAAQRELMAKALTDAADHWLAIIPEENDEDDQAFARWLRRRAERLARGEEPGTDG